MRPSGFAGSSVPVVGSSVVCKYAPLFFPDPLITTYCLSELPLLPVPVESESSSLHAPRAHTHKAKLKNLKSVLICTSICYLMKLYPNLTAKARPGFCILKLSYRRALKMLVHSTETVNSDFLPKL